MLKQVCISAKYIFIKVATGIKPGEIKEIHLTSNIQNFLYPCGACLQVMAELCSKDLMVFIYKNEYIKVEKFQTLFPNPVRKESF